MFLFAFLFESALSDGRQQKQQVSGQINALTVTVTNVLSTGEYFGIAVINNDSDSTAN